MPEFNDDLTLIGGTFTDSGEGDVDFYTFWYSLCYSLGILEIYTDELIDIENNKIMIERFLKSKGVIIRKGMSIEELYTIYSDWVGEVRNRGTERISDLKGFRDEVGLRDYDEDPLPLVNVFANSGISLLGNWDIECLSPVNITEYFALNFSVLFKGESLLINKQLFTDLSDFWVRITTDDTPTDGVVIVSVYININSVETLVSEISCNVNEIVSFKIVRNETVVILYVNGEIINKLTVTAEGFIFTHLMSGIGAGSNLIIGAMGCEVFDEDFKKLIKFDWDFSVGSGFTIPCSDPLYKGVIQGSDRNTPIDIVWGVEPLFTNCEYIGMNAELRRLFDYKFREFIYELIKDSELGLTIDVSSFISEEANCYNLNKLLGKGSVIDLHKLGITFNSIVKPYSDNGYIKYNIPVGDVDYYGLNASLPEETDWRVNEDYKPTGLIPFVPIPVANYLDNFDGYEISFVIRSEVAIDLQFSILAYNEQLENISGVLAKYADDALSDEFLNLSNWSLPIDTDVHIRAAYTPNKITGIGDTLSINVGDNLYNIGANESFCYIVPVIRIRNYNEVAGIISIKDIVVRPLTLPTSKGIVYPKNEVVIMSNNNSGRLTREILEEIDKLVPYNSTVNLQIL